MNDSDHQLKRWKDNRHVDADNHDQTFEEWSRLYGRAGVYSRAAGPIPTKNQPRSSARSSAPDDGGAPKSILKSGGPSSSGARGNAAKPDTEGLLFHTKHR